MINFLDVAMPDPVEETSNINIYIAIGLAVVLAIAIVVT